MEDGVRTAHDRLLQAVRSGAWERVPDQADAFAAAVRADERKRVMDDAVAAIKSVFEADDIDNTSSQQIRGRCLAALERLY